MTGLRLIAEESGRLAQLLPLSVVEDVAERLGRGEVGEWPTLRTQVAQAVPSPHHRALVVAFLDRWRSDAAEVPPQSVATALLTAALAARDRREGQAAELVWTGPDSGAIPLRRTEQAILQVINSAERRLLVVSYAVYRIPRIGEALVRAASRGAALTVIVETPDPQAGKDAYDTLRALGTDVAMRSHVYFWPRDRRPKDQNGKSGILHVKCVVADGRWLFLSSANLTEYAFTINMELGILITGGEHPPLVEGLFRQLIAAGMLEVVTPGD